MKKYSFKLNETALPALVYGDDVTIRGGVWHGYSAKFVRFSVNGPVVALPSRPEVLVPKVFRSRRQVEAAMEVAI